MNVRVKLTSGNSYSIPAKYLIIVDGLLIVTMFTQPFAVAEILSYESIN
jgi:hypothetical protein